MRIDVLTLFPEMFNSLKTSIIGRALDNRLFELEMHNIRDFSTDKHLKCDDTPFGGGAGMVMTPQPLRDSILKFKTPNSKVIYMSPCGTPLNQNKVKELAKEEHLIILCGHYEGIDQRIIDLYVDEEISIGDYVLTGGELPAMVLIDSVSRMIPDVISSESKVDESFEDGLLEYPQYTRPFEFEGLKVPEVLISGHHENIENWRKDQSLKLTKERRPDLIKTTTVEFVVRAKQDCTNRVLAFLSHPERKTLYNNICADFDIHPEELGGDNANYVANKVEIIYDKCYVDMLNQAHIFQTFWDSIKLDVMDEFERIFGLKSNLDVIKAYMWPSVVCPYDEEGFYVSYSPVYPNWNNALKTCIHELIHHFWWLKWDQTFKRNKKMLKYEYPSSSWFFSEMVVQIIVQNSSLLKYIGKRKISYEDFYEMDVDGINLMQKLDELYKNNDLENFMKLAYKFVDTNLDVIQAQYNR